MTHKHFSQPPTELFRAKLKVLFDSVNSIWQINQTEGGVLEDDIKSLYHSALSLFLDTLDGSLLGASMRIQEGLPSDPFNINIFTAAIQKDLQILFLEMAALDKLIAAGFNSIISEREQVLQSAKRISNKIGDYLLYADTNLGNGFFFGDSFNTASNIETSSSSNDQEECYLSTDEGSIFLPLDGAPNRPKIKSFIINQNSNGTPGNNFSIDATTGHKEIAALGDNEPNTWYEYERVTAFESSIPLVLDITIVLDSPSIINHIHINPINFGTLTPVYIAKMETSLDGVEYKSIKDDVPIVDFVSEPEKDIFSLSPSTSKYTGQGFYSFLPRRVQYIHLTFEQTSPYSINTINGERLRYAIGLRDINILGRKYKTQGSIVSTPFQVNDEVKKLALWASENPIETSTLADITHSISADDGATWIPIQPQRRAGFDIDEVVNFNNIADNSISTNTPVKILRHKISLKRFPDAFTGEATIKQEKLSKEETVQLSTAGGSEIILSAEPIEESVRLVLPYWGSFGCPRPKKGSAIRGQSKLSDLDHIEFNIDSPPTGTIRFPLPYPLSIDDLVHKIRVFVNGEQWEYSSKSEELLGSGTSYGINGIDENSKIYFLNKQGRELQFGMTDDEGNDYGLLPPNGSRVEVCLDGDNPLLELTENGYVLNLSMPSDGFKDNMQLVSFEALNDTEKYVSKQRIPAYKKRLSAKKVLKKKRTTMARKIALPVYVDLLDIEERDLETNMLITGDKIHTVQKTFIDGETEFYDSETGDYIPEAYSYDKETGKLYLASPTGNDRTTIASIEELNAKEIEDNKWSYFIDPITGKLDTSRIILDPSVVYTIKRQKEETVSSVTNSLSLIDDRMTEHSWHRQKLVKGTVKLPQSLFESNALPTEVVYVDGVSELSNVIHVSEELIPSSTTSTTVYTLKGISSNNSLIDSTIGFGPVRQITSSQAPDNQFINYIEDGVLVSDGDWTYEKSGDTVTVTVLYTGGINEHYVSYDYEVVNSGIDYRGQYSIDYNNGIVYFSQPPQISVTPHLIEFEVSLYTAFYNIAEPIEDYMIEQIISEEKKIILTQNFTSRFIKLDTIKKARPSYVKAIYNYYKKTTQSLEDLEPYFSPIAKDVAFKAITTRILEEL